MKKSNALSIILVLTAGILWGCMGIFVRNLNALGLETMGIVAVRTFITCILIGIYLAIFKRDLFRIKLKDIWCFLGTGIASVLFFNFCYFKAMTLTSLSVAAILLYTAPIIIMIMSYFLFKEKFNKYKIVALVMTFVGCIYVSGIIEKAIQGDGAGGSLCTGTAFLFGLGAGFGYALYSIFSRYAIERGYHSLTITFYTFLFASIGSIPFIAPKMSSIISVSTGSAKGLLLCFGIAIIGTLIPYITYTAGLKGMDNGRAAVVVSVEPAVATLVSLLVYHERLSVWGISGILLVLGAVIIVNLTAKK